MSILTPRFNFFDKELLKDPDNGGQVFERLKEVDITCSTSGRGQLVIGSREGTVYIVDKQLDISAFTAHTKCLTHTHQLRQTPYLFTIGEDLECDQFQCKLWHMDRVNSTGTPHCSRIIRLSHLPSKDSPSVKSHVTAFTVHENMQLMAVGFRQGTVCLYKGDLTKDRQCKSSIIHDGKQEITGLGLRVVGKSQMLFVGVSDTLLGYAISGYETPVQCLHENYGFALKCCAMGDDMIGNQFLIGRIDGVYYIQPEGRGGTAPLEGEKYQVHCYRGYLLTVGKSNINQSMDIVTIYDTQNKFIAYSGPIPRVSNILFEWNTICVLGGDNKIYLLQEKSTPTKLEILFKKNQYITAINIAKSQHYDKHGLLDIFRLYGDYLYKERGDPDRAIEQYIKTIGQLEPSYVIRRFLDAQRLHNLTAYLEELHNKHYATDDHTTLLLNCYTKLKDEDKLDEFIQKKDKNNVVNFDIETAIRVLRQSDYHYHALQLAEHHHRHEWYMKIQLENIKDYKAALSYMQNLSFEEAEDNMKKYGKILIQHLPEETTQLLKSLCLGQYSEGRRARPDEYIHIFVNNSTQLREFLQAMISSDVKPATIVYNTLIELYLQEWAASSHPQETKRCEKKIMVLLNSKSDYAKDQALVLCQTHKFKPGILFLYEQGKLYQQIVRYYMDQDDYDNVIVSCKSWGTIEPQLWIMALSYFAKKEDDCKSEMEEVLLNIDRNQLLPPLLVIQTLANSRVCTLGVVKNFLMDRLETENVQIEEDEKAIQQYSDQTKTLRHRINDLKTSPTVFQVARCSVCKYPLELPSIHFLCQHSYHTHCFESYAENENDCPACLEENRRILEKIREHERTKDTDINKSFKSDLESAHDGFKVVAEYFGKGVFDKVTLLSEPIADDIKPTTLPSPAVSKPTTPRNNPFGSASDTGHQLHSKEPPSRTGSLNTAATSQAANKSEARVGSRVRAADSDVDVEYNKPKQRASQQQPIKLSTERKQEINAPTNSLIKSEPAAHSPKSNQYNPNPSKSSSHTRQSSAGRMIESGLSFIKGHRRQGSDQTRSSSRPATTVGQSTVSGGGRTQPRPATIHSQGPSTKSGRSSKPATVSSNRTFGEAKNSISNISKASNPFEDSNPFKESVKPKKEQKPKAAANPFEEPSNPFEESTNPFEEPANPFEESTNPFEEPTNPFENESKNPFE